MPVSEEDLFACLETLDIPHVTHRHQPVFTVDESTDLYERLPGGHCKTLFLKDKKGVYLLAVVLAARRVDLKALGRNKDVPGGRLSFASAGALWDRLGVKPGSVTPFALLNETSKGLHVILDKAMLEYSPLNYHPLHNTATTTIAPDDLIRFIRHCGHEPMIIDFDAV